MHYQKKSTYPSGAQKVNNKSQNLTNNSELIIAKRKLSKYMKIDAVKLVESRVWEMKN